MKKIMCVLLALSFASVASAEVTVTKPQKTGDKYRVVAKNASVPEVLEAFLGAEHSGISVTNRSSGEKNITTPGTGLTGDSVHDVLRVMLAEHYDYSIVLDKDNNISRIVVDDKISATNK